MVVEEFFFDRGDPNDRLRLSERRVVDRGDGVRFWDRCAIRADFRGEYGSQLSAKPCFGVGGVWMPEAGDGVEAASSSISAFL